MSANTRFTVAMHIVTWMAQASQQFDLMTSEQIAQSVNTNPSNKDRILGLLHHARLVNVQRGTNAGWTLARPAAQISLLDVYQAIEQEPLFELHHTLPNQACPIGRGIQSALTFFYSDAEMALKQQLAHSTVADVLEKTLAVSSQRTE